MEKGQANLGKPKRKLGQVNLDGGSNKTKNISWHQFL